jgi:hypothetical protein
MFNKINNRQLLAIFGLLLTVVVIVKFMDSRKGERNFSSDLFKPDTADLVQVNIVNNQQSGQSYLLEKVNDRWQIVKEGETYRADDAAVSAILTALQDLKPKRVAATDRSRWENYEVTDSTAIRVDAETKQGKRFSVYIGKFSYQQPKGQNPYAMQGGPSGTMTSYIRPGNEEIVYAVDGFLRMTFGRSVDDLRDKTIISGNPAQWRKLSYTYPGDSSFVLTRNDGGWNVNDLKADSVATMRYLNKIKQLDGVRILNDMNLTGAAYSLEIETFDAENSLQVKAFEYEDGSYLIESSENKGVAIDGNTADLFNRLFVSKNKFLK